MFFWFCLVWAFSILGRFACFFFFEREPKARQRVGFPGLGAKGSSLKTAKKKQRPPEICKTLDFLEHQKTKKRLKHQDEARNLQVKNRGFCQGLPKFSMN